MRALNKKGWVYRRLTEQEAIFGCVEFGIKALDLSKSSGPTLGGIKKNWIDVENRKMDPALETLVRDLLCTIDDVVDGSGEMEPMLA